jgi:thiamine transport system permease protein
MAQRFVPLIWPGAAVAAALALLTLGTLGAVLARAEGTGLGPADWAAVRFTLAQAVVSAVLSVALAVPVARALARRSFPGRGALIALKGAPFLLPVIVAVLGLLAVFGRQGGLNTALEALGLPPVSIYGFHGVVLAHLFLNLPLAVRMILAGWHSIPAERFRLAAALGLGPREVALHLEWPMLRSTVPGALAVVFLLCLTSFAVALVLGGGPRATTVELAIYQALRFDFDLGRAALLAALQFALCGLAVLTLGRFTLPTGFGAGLDRPVLRWDASGLLPRLADTLAICAAALFLLVPLAMVVMRGLPGLADLPSGTWPAASRSLAVALTATALCLTAALALALSINTGRGARLMETAGMLPLAASPLVLGTGLFLLIHPITAPDRLSLPVTALVNAAMALPFALRLILPALREIEAAHGKLADALGLTGAARLRWLILPRLSPVLGFAAGLVAALSMGDLGVIALFAGNGTETLPLLTQRLMGAYRMEAAAGTALLLVTISFALFWIFDAGGRRALP